MNRTGLALATKSMVYGAMPDAHRTPAQSLAALKFFRAMQSDLDGPIDEESGLLVEDIDAAIAALGAATE